MSTPGHGANTCSKIDALILASADPEAFYSQPVFQWGRIKKMWQYRGHYHWYCPACGVRLVPDPEPLPVPEGCYRPDSQAEGNMWRVRALTINPHEKSWRLYGPTQKETEDAFRRAFTKEPK